MKSLEDLKKMREEMQKKVELRNSDTKYRIVVGMATCGIAAGARPVLAHLVEETQKNNYNCVVTQTGCIGLCSFEPIIEVFDKNGNKTTYVQVDVEKADKILASHIKNDIIVEEFTVAKAK